MSLLGGCGSNSSQSSAGTESAQTATESSDNASVSNTASSTEQAGGDLQGGPPGGMMGGGAVDKSGDTVLQSMIANVEPKFQQFEYTDSETGKTLAYNLYIPDDYDPSKSYPMVLFIADSSVIGQDTTAPLKQGSGGGIWGMRNRPNMRASCWCPNIRMSLSMTLAAIRRMNC
ncbi:hypothetical protein ICC18_32040 [Paenibacillus sp. WST5]|uniref:Uncharacterized protein n=1 Tax=Paenibacillus sedimenti TaxID=2770274 RepID=A0A926QNE1_9BACL|nr:hypothetical protein [Paenibacillus sedimenti]